MKACGGGWDFGLVPPGHLILPTESWISRSLPATAEPYLTYLGTCLQCRWTSRRYVGALPRFDVSRDPSMTSDDYPVVRCIKPL